MSVEPSTELEQLADRYVTAYTTEDYETLEKVLDPNIRMRHFNRGVDGTGSVPAIQQMKDFSAILPDKGFSERSLIKQIDDETVIVKHVWGGNLKADLPGFGSEGEKLALTLVTFMTFANGRLVDYQDFG